MSAVRVHLISAFVDDNGEGGNPAGVVLEADSLSNPAKQAVAASVGLSETAFVSSSDVADFKLDFFTPTRQIAHCGHATIATFCYLVQLGRLSDGPSSKETIDGVRAIQISGDRAYMQQSAPKYILSQDWPDVVGDRSVMDSLGLGSKELVDGLSPLVVNTGNSFMLIPLRRRSALAAISPDFHAIEAISDALDLIGYYPFTLDTPETGFDASTRMFAPRYGIPEESATGMAAGPLACYVHDYMKMERATVVVDQGRFMTPPSPSKISVELTIRLGKITNLMAGGRARLKRTIETSID